MRRPRLVRLVVSVAVSLLAGASMQASTVMQLNLGQLVERAEHIYRGTVLSVSAGTVAVGGGQLPITVYRLRVEESFRGEFQEVKGIRIAEIRTLGKFTPVQRGNLRSAVVLPRMPDLAVGSTYLVMTTRPSAIGLSISVGLGQGVFRIGQVGKDETAVNDANNTGLFRDMPGAGVAPGARSLAATPAAGPLSYQDLAGRIRGLLAR
jgi:hypothetical protein